MSTNRLDHIKKLWLKHARRHLHLFIFLLLIIFTSSSFGEYWGSIKSNKYHNPNCPYAQRIKPENLIRFDTLEKAINTGYIPCKSCKPDHPKVDKINSKDNIPDVQEAIKARGYCTRVIDGDTIVVNINGVQEKIRLIGVDTPETVHPSKPVEYFGKEASEFTRRMVEGKMVRLEYDWQKKDKYGRTLAYVYLEDGTFLNAEIIKQGYGFAYTRFPFKYLDEFRTLEREVREKQRGLWAK